jgi:hypothetical protein
LKSHVKKYQIKRNEEKHLRISKGWNGFCQGTEIFKSEVLKGVGRHYSKSFTVLPQKNVEAKLMNCAKH